jgi:hypothetical protein
MKKLMYNEFERMLMRDNTTLTGGLLNLNLAKLKFLRELERTWKRSKFYKICTLL